MPRPQLSALRLFSDAVLVLVLPAVLSVAAALVSLPLVYGGAAPALDLDVTFYREAWCDNSSASVTMRGMSAGSVVDVVGGLLLSSRAVCVCCCLVRCDASSTLLCSAVLCCALLLLYCALFCCALLYSTPGMPRRW